MITRVIHNTFELDLSNIPLTRVEENNIFKGKLVSKYTYPIEIDLTPEQIVALNHITDHNATNRETIFEVDFYTMEEKHDAILEVEKIIGKKAYLQIHYGLEEFPNHSTQLSDLPLERIELLQSIFTYAESIIPQTYPAVNFNFPQVITDQFDTESEQWQYFEGIVNNYVNGDFLINEYDSNANENVNRNVLQPLPYLLHVLKVGLEQKGYTLEGDVLTDPLLKKATIYALSEFYYSATALQETVEILTDEYDSINEENFGTYTHEINLPEPGRYKIAGNAIVRTKSPAVSDSDDVTETVGYVNFTTNYGYFRQGTSSLSFNGHTKWSKSVGINFQPNLYREKFRTIDFNIDYTGNEGPLIFDSHQYSISEAEGSDPNEPAMVLDVTITQLAKYDNNGDLVPTLVTPNQIDLTKCVPKKTYGELFEEVLSQKNYGFTINDNVVTLSKKTSIINQNNEALDLSDFEAKIPERNFNKGKSFVLAYPDFNSEDYDFGKILITKDDYQLAPFNRPDDAQDIPIKMIPLPLKQKGDVVTAHGFLDDDSKTQLVFYDGLDANSLNTSDTSEEMSILNIYLNSYQEWLNFLFNSVNYIWRFKTYYVSMIGLKIDSIIYAYKQYHLIKKLTRKTKDDEILEVEIETETLE